jgi:hypothetical protein
MIRQLMRFSFVCLVLLVAMSSVQAQTGKYTINGYIKDGSSGEVLINATITMQPSGVAVMTNSYGYCWLPIQALRPFKKMLT